MYLWDGFLKVWLLGHKINACIFARLCHSLLCKCCTVLHSHQQRTRVPSCPQHRQNLFSIFWVFIILRGKKRCLSKVLICMSLVSEAKHLFDVKGHLSFYHRTLFISLLFLEALHILDILTFCIIYCIIYL